MSDDISLLHNELFEVILSLSSIEECKAFFSDLCTEKELDSFYKVLKEFLFSI